MATVTIKFTDGPVNGPDAADLIMEVTGDEPQGHPDTWTKAQHAAIACVRGIADVSGEVKYAVMDEEAGSVH